MKQKLLKSSNILSTILEAYKDAKRNPTRVNDSIISGSPESEGLKKLTDKFDPYYYKNMGFKKEDKPFIVNTYKKAMKNIKAGEGLYGKHEYTEIAPGFEKYAKMSDKSKRLRERALRKMEEKYKE